MAFKDKVLERMKGWYAGDRAPDALPRTPAQRFELLRIAVDRSTLPHRLRFSDGAGWIVLFCADGRLLSAQLCDAKGAEVQFDLTGAETAEQLRVLNAALTAHVAAHALGDPSFYPASEETVTGGLPADRLEMVEAAPEPAAPATKKAAPPVAAPAAPVDGSPAPAVSNFLALLGGSAGAVQGFSDPGRPALADEGIEVLPGGGDLTDLAGWQAAVSGGLAGPLVLLMIPEGTGEDCLAVAMSGPDRVALAVPKRQMPQLCRVGASV